MSLWGTAEDENEEKQQQKKSAQAKAEKDDKQVKLDIVKSKPKPEKEKNMKASNANPDSLKDDSNNASGFFAEQVKPDKPKKPKVVKVKTKKKDMNDMESWLMSAENPTGTSCVMFYGRDGTGKTGLAQDSPLRGGGKMIIFDMDRSNLPIWESYHGSDPNILIKDPVTMRYDEDGRFTVDYLDTMNRMKAAMVWLKENYEEQNITVVVLDGLNKLLKYAEYQMRTDANIDESGGVSMRYWIKRSKSFMEVLEIMKGLPIHKIYIAHEDFIVSPETASVKINTNQLMDTKVMLTRTVDEDGVSYVATIDKHKSNSTFEGRTIEFLKVDGKKATWDSKELWKMVAWRPKK